MKDKLLSIILNILMICFIPVFITSIMTGIKVENSTISPIITVKHNDELLELELEDYIIGVVAAEMPASYEIEALKAQAVCARTFTLKHLESNEETVFTSDIQSYLTKEELKERWSLENFFEYYSAIEEAVHSTTGIIITYEGEPISAVFHALSSGYTRDAKNIWGYDIPYLVSCNSEWDKASNNYQKSYEFTRETILSRCNIENQLSENSVNLINSIQKDNTGYVVNIKLAGVDISGEEFRSILNLASSNFNIVENGDIITIETLGYGHGVGLSQFGANQLAKQGYLYNEIINYYYQDIQLNRI